MGDFERLIGSILGAERAMEKGCQQGIYRAGVKIAATAKEKLGNYQPSVGEYPAWATLKSESVRRKFITKRGNLKQSGRAFVRKHGSLQPSGTEDDSPLVDRGDLRRGITVDDSELEQGNVYVGVVRGNVAMYGAVQEFGSARRNIPPRPYLRPAVVENQEQIEEEIKNAIAEQMASFGQGGFLP